MPTTIIPGYPGVGYTSAYGGVPRVPDPLSTMHETIRGDIGALPNLYNLTTGVSGASAAGARTQYQANLPLYTPMTGAASQNILDELHGIVAPDVINLLRSQGAEGGVGFGVDSPASNAAYLRALGLTSIGLQQQGQKDLTAAIGRTPVGPMFNPASMLTTPEQEQAAQMAANLYAAAPIPSAAAAANNNAAARGLNAGLGAGGGYRGGGMPSYPGIGGGGYTSPGVGYSTGTGTTIGGVTYYGGETPASAADAWQRWAAGLPGGTGTAAGANDYSLGDIMTPDWWAGEMGSNAPSDVYAYTGLTPEDISGAGMSAGDVFGGGGGANNYSSPGPVLDMGSNDWSSMMDDFLG